MKIVTQTKDELLLKEGSASGIIVGVAFILAGMSVGIYLRSTSKYAVLLAVGVAALGIVVILMSSSITVDINKTSGQISYQKKRLIGGSSNTFAIADVFRIETRKQWQLQNAGAPNQGNPGNAGANMPQPVLVAQSVIVFKSGQEIPLDHQKTASTMSVGSAVLMSGQGAEAAIANTVATFMGVPFQEIVPPTMNMGINMGGSGTIQI